MRTLVTIILTALLAASATWFALRQSTPTHDGPEAASPRQAQFYQCSMHPWIKSEKAGRCTICGMELTPAYAGEKSMEETGGDAMVALTQSQIQVLHVQTVEAKSRPLVRNLPVAGVIAENSSRHRVLAAYVDGRLDKLEVNYLGAEVSAGQPLADFYSPTLLQAEREYRQLGGELRHNTALRLRQMGLTPAQINALDQKPADALTSQILSPISGTVVAQSAYEGQYVATGAPLFEIADFSTMWFQFRAYEQDLPWIQTGLSVRVTTPSLPGKSFTGKIIFIDPNFDESTRSTNVRVELPNPSVNGRRELLNRLYAEGLVELSAPTVLSVPRSAVIETGAQAVVYVDRDGGAYERTVIQAGRRGDSLLEVLSGLKEGDKVVTNGNLLIDGQAELNRSFMAPPEDDAGAADTPAAAAAPSVVLKDVQKQAIAGFTQAADALAAALGADDLAAFNAASEPAMQATAALVKQLTGRDLAPQGPGLGGVDAAPPPVLTAGALAALERAGHFHGIKDLQGARVAFHGFSMAATTALQPLRRNAGMPDFQVYECPMVNQAIPGVPKKGRWIQTGGRALLNPFFGKEMAECGNEINR